MNSIKDYPYFCFDINRVRHYLNTNCENNIDKIKQLELMDKICLVWVVDIKDQIHKFNLDRKKNKGAVNIKEREINDENKLREIVITTYLEKLKKLKEEISQEKIENQNDNIYGDNPTITDINKIHWSDNNYLSLMGLIELLEYAGYIPENSYKNCGAIAANLFSKRDGKQISRKGFNNKKADYERNKAEILGKIIDDLKAANDKIIP